MRSVFIITIMAACHAVGLAQKFKVDIDFDCFVTTVKMPDHVIEASVWDDADKKVKVEQDKWYTWFRSNMIVSTQAGYDGKLLHGEYQEFYLDKNMKKQGKYHFGLKDGVWKEWYTNGTLKSVYNWNNGLLHGEFSEYTESGDITIKGVYKDGILHGRHIEYVHGEPKNEVVFNKRELVPPKAPKQKPEKIKDEKKPEKKKGDKGKGTDEKLKKKNTPKTCKKKETTTKKKPATDGDKKKDKKSQNP